MRMTAAVTIFAAGVVPASSADWFESVWCEAGGERLIIDERGVGFNEHTICEWSEGRPDAGALDAVALCANLYADGEGGWVRMDERRVRLEADLSDPDTIMVTVEDGEPAQFSRCDW